MEQITYLSRKYFPKVVKNMLIFDKSIKNDLFNKNRSHLNKIEYKFEGRYLCGLSTYILGYFLSNNYKVEIKKSTIGYGSYYEDHCYLLLNNEIIVDPTIRQFLTDSRDNGFSAYSKYIYENKEPIFVGNKITLNRYFNKLNVLNKDVFGTSSLNIYDLHLYWRGNYDITKKLNNLILAVDNKKEINDSYNQRLIKSLKDLN